MATEQNTQVVRSAELAPVRPFGGLPVPAYVRDIGEGIFTSLPTETDAERFTLLGVIQAESFKMADAINNVIRVENVVIHPAGKLDPETDEYDSWLRVVLVLDGGDLMACASIGVLKSLGQYAACTKRRPPWHPPAEFQVKQIASGKNRYYQLVAVQPGQKVK